MKKIALLFSVAILATSCNAQGNESSLGQSSESQLKPIPEGSWSVNKEVDENGNIVRYDSIYSWSSSSRNGLHDAGRINPDSIMQEMQKRMRMSFGVMGADPFEGFFGNDSTQTDPFLNPFFSSSRMGGFPALEEMRKRMEAMQQQFFQREERPWIPAVPEEKNKTKNKRSQRSI